jgi:hypothetical protein
VTRGNANASTYTQPPRVERRPDSSQWGDADLLRLTDAAARFWLHGPLSAASLRTAHPADKPLAYALFSAGYLDRAEIEMVLTHMPFRSQTTRDISAHQHVRGEADFTDSDTPSITASALKAEE